MMQMATDPFQGNVKALQGKEWRGVFRRRIGDYRLLFSASATTEPSPSSVYSSGPARRTGRFSASALADAEPRLGGKLAGAR
jgi:hypothetical protein